MLKMASDSTEAKENPEIKSAGMSRNYFCIDCKCTTRNPRLYLEHRRDFHKEPIAIHECEYCVYASKHSQKLARHLRTVHRDVVQDITAQSMRNNCNQSCESMPDGFQSLQAGKNTRLSTCKLCGLYTVSKTVLMDHVRAQHPDVRIYECDQCDYSHYIRDRYNRHHRYHSMNQIRCKMCEFQTIYRWNLERHMRHHIDTVSLGFRCNKCNFTASTKQSITAHEIAHHSGLQPQNNLTNKSETLQLNDMESISVKQEVQSEDDDKHAENSSEFDASAFLEVVMNDDGLTEPENNCQISELKRKQEHKDDIQDRRKLSKTKCFYCINCNFRNDIDWSHWNLEEPPASCPQQTIVNSLPAPNSLYRCGYCHQTSNWKHVIERHCRLVHNTPALIEKYSVQDDSFKTFTSTKRRPDLSTDTVITTKKKVPDKIDDEKPFEEFKASNEMLDIEQNLD